MYLLDIFVSLDFRERCVNISQCDREFVFTSWIFNTFCFVCFQTMLSGAYIHDYLIVLNHPFYQ